MIEENLPLVTTVIKREITLGEDTWEDLFQVGSYALVLAAERFDSSKGCKFSTFAYPYIKGMLQTYKNRHSDSLHGVVIPRKMREDFIQCVGYARENDLDIERDLAYIQGKLGMEKTNMLTVSSLDRQLNSSDSESITLGEMIPDKEDNFEGVEFGIFLDTVQKVLREELKEKHYNIIDCMIQTYLETGVTLTQKQVAEKIGCSHTLVQKVVKKAVDILRRNRVIG